MSPQRKKGEVVMGICEWRDDKHILLLFWIQTERESKEADDVCYWCQSWWFYPPVRKLNPTVGLLWEYKTSNSLSGNSVFFEHARIFRIQKVLLFMMFPQVNSALEQRYFLTLHKLWWLGWNVGLPQMLCLLHQTDEFSTANVWREPQFQPGK